ncbi:MAG: M15 family metallopeptidase, partial [Marmoricola sp.]
LPLVVVAVLALAGCDGSAEGGTPEAGASTAGGSSSAPASGSAAPSDPAGASGPASTSASAGGGQDPSASGVDPAHAVDPPGRRTGLIAPPDIIATGSRTIDPRAVAAVRRLKGVVDVEQIALAQVPIENRALEVAAVDPGSYRNYVTDVASAETAAVWQRVAGGEVAVRPELRKRVPIDHDGYLSLGSTADAPKVHVGAWAPQTWEVDAVVNDSWIDTLHMTPGNALLIRTGGTAPATLRRPIERILRGTEASVQMTDVVARVGLDPHVVQTAVVVGTIADAVGTYRYTVLGDGHIAPDPAWVRAHITTEAVPILGPVTCNKMIFPQLRAALEQVVQQGLTDKIHPNEYAGCFNPRFIAGTTTLSNHAFGLALDLNAIENQRGTVGQMDRGVVAIFKRWGFTWGGDWHYTDPMHFEMNQLVAPR